MNRSGSSPPSPVLLLAPMRFIAIASVSCASLLIEPNDMAPVVNRLTISFAGSTSSRGIGCRQELELEQAAQIRAPLALVVHELGKLGEGLRIVGPRRVLELVDRVRIPVVVLALDAIVDLPAEIELPDRCRLIGLRDAAEASLRRSPGCRSLPHATACR